MYSVDKDELIITVTVIAIFCVLSLYIMSVETKVTTQEEHKQFQLRVAGRSLGMTKLIKESGIGTTYVLKTTTTTQEGDIGRFVANGWAVIDIEVVKNYISANQIIVTLKKIEE